MADEGSVHCISATDDTFLGSKPESNTGFPLDGMEASSLSQTLPERIPTENGGDFTAPMVVPGQTVGAQAQRLKNGGAEVAGDRLAAGQESV
jgi:hypothetical protein